MGRWVGVRVGNVGALGRGVLGEEIIIIIITKSLFFFLSPG